MNDTRNRNMGPLMLLILLLLLAALYGYWPMLHLLPQGSHLWRQTDCMAMVWNYKLYPLSFFEPATFNLQSDGGRVAGELPVFYYLAAQSSNPEFALRAMHSFVFLSGIVAVYFMAFYFLENSLLSVVAAVLLFTSPLLVFYGNNFLSDVPAWSFAMMGWALFLPAHKKNHAVLLVLAFSCFAFSALLKASYALNFIIVVVFQLSTFNFQLSTKRLLPYSLLLIPLSWYIYAKWYNAQHHDTYYFLSVFPIWKMSLYDIGLTGWRLLVSWSGNYFWRPTSIMLIAGIIYLFAKNTFVHAGLKRLLLLSFVMTVAYGLLFFERLKLHEYYYTYFFVFAVFAVIAVLSLLQAFSGRLSFRIFLFIFLAVNIFCCRNTVRQKLQDQPYNAVLAGVGFQSFLIAHGCTEDKTVIAWYDPSVNQSLYWMKRKGYTAYNDYPTVFRNRPADFLVLTAPDFIGFDALNIAPGDSLGSYQGVRLYKLK